MPAAHGIIQVSADKNYVWGVKGSKNADGTPITIQKSTGSKNWRKNGNYFQVVYRGPAKITPKSYLTQQSQPTAGTV